MVTRRFQFGVTAGGIGVGVGASHSASIENGFNARKRIGPAEFCRDVSTPAAAAADINPSAAATRATPRRNLARTAASPTGQSCVSTVPSARRYNRTHIRPFPAAPITNASASSRLIADRLCTLRLHCAQCRVFSSPVIPSQSAVHGDAIVIRSSTGKE
jgi:hypothetical protein